MEWLCQCYQSQLALPRRRYVDVDATHYTTLASASILSPTFLSMEDFYSASA